MPRGHAGRDVLGRAFQGWEWHWEVPAPSPWQAQPAWNGSLRNVCLNHAKVIKVCDLIQPPIPLWSGSDHPSHFSALFPHHLGCSGGFIPISLAKHANTSLHFCNVNYNKNPNPVLLHINGQILSASEPTFHRNCEFHHPKSAGQAGHKSGKIP